MRQELIEQLLADHDGERPGPSTLDLDLDLEQASLSVGEDAQPSGAPDTAARLPRVLTAFDVVDEDAEARAFARRRLVGVAVAGAGSTAALVAAFALGF